MGVANEQEFHKEIKVASQLARQAGDVIMKIYDTKYEVASKGKAGPVTEADLRSSELIVEGLHQAFPHDLVVSEEALPPGGQAAERVWYVDPLDGTKEFISKNGEFSVMIGLAINGHARAGVVYKPVGAVLFWGITGKEACLEQDGTQTPLKVSNQAVLRELRLVVSRSHRLPVIDQVRDRLGITQEIPSGSVGLKIGMIVNGGADLYVDPSGFTSAWDVCGPEAVLSGAGGRLTDLGGESIVYGTGELRNKRGLIATNGACHDQVVSALAPVVREAKLIP